ncbi:undecaprenyl/decaprenyl-phosphate alpha-N-acetylglucosaminyl 1-phosphate transferase [Litoribacter alkaliphilus]|uniref:Undecaprenyl/decaprenyl-phosphate alpha-N-acetylglucosaminyl 1-phosphate transferase n=1 Tax=Litoribacter ruber TaxID=702568 RepID=A0AAP2CKZ5_9BACT|nr:MraY family glycosyltransferase [Litoribacter alkaliphilus]MBS9525699.1 undecaprenyl/decaprenyl-phosphate alpha-N-acetylglucosaminyl 1-phosphate transferase [Litoribacter alkaliphilus]
MLSALPFFIQVGLFLVVPMLITYYMIPKIVWVAREKELVVKPDHRSSHHIITPSFGGVAFFICFIICYSFLKNFFPTAPSTFVIPAVTLLFVVGLKDDLMASSARAKFIGQLIAVSMVMMSPDFYQLNLHGFIGIYAIPPYISIPLIFFFMVGFINAFNLIDGVDGLAAFLGIVMLGALAFLFNQAGNYFYILTCMILIGMLLAYIRFNFSKSLSKKIFMGDTGSLVIGFLLAFLSLKALTLECGGMNLPCYNLPPFLLLILAVPIFDTLRVMVVRYFQGKNILLADRNHIHHILIDLGYTHLKTSLVLSCASAVLIFIGYQLSFYLNWPAMMIFLLGISLIMAVLFNNLKRKVKPMKLNRKKLDILMRMFF